MKKQLNLIILLLTTLGLGACAGTSSSYTSSEPTSFPSEDPSTPSEPTHISVLAVNLNHTSYTLHVNETLQLEESIYPSNATNKEVTWSVISGNEYIFVSNTGLVYAIGVGQGTVGVNTVDGNKTAVCVLTVVGNSSSEEPSSSDEPSSEIPSSSEEPIPSEPGSSEDPSISSEPSSSEPSSSQPDDDERVEWIGNDTYPYYSTPSTRFAMSLEAGWNLGNTLDAHTDSVNVEESYIDLDKTLSDGINELDIETCYGNPKATLELLRSVKASGYTTIRIPVSWHQHVSINNNFKISINWMNRVKTVVDNALSLGFKVMLNTHHDIDPSFIYPDYAHLDNSKRFIQSVWTQISEVFGTYGTNLIYEGFNEPRITKNNDSFNTELNTNEVNDCINQLNQMFVDTIRSSKLESEQKRFLVIKAYADSAYLIVYDNAHKFVLPDDPSNRLLVSVHIYNPTEFAFQGTGGFDPNNDEDVSHIRWILDGLYQQYIIKGIGVIVGEWGSVATSYNLQDRIAHSTYFVEQTYLRHIPSIYWDNGRLDGEAFGLFDRTTNTNAYPAINEAINSIWTVPGNKYNINYYNGNNLIYTEKVVEGRTPIGPYLPWCYGYDDLYQDASLYTPFSLDTPIYGDKNIYLSNYGVRPTYTCEADNNWGPVDDKYVYTSNGEWHYTAPGKGKDVNYETQINFSLPILFDNTNYEISFAYQISGENGLSLVYNDEQEKSVGNVINMNGNGKWHHTTISFNSNEVTNGETRFTFSLSAIPSHYSSINFGIKDLSIKNI